MSAHTVTRQDEVPAGVVDLDLNVTIVTAGPVDAGLLSSTDDGCGSDHKGFAFRLDLSKALTDNVWEYR